MPQPNKNTPQNIATAQTLQGITAQVLQNQKDLGVAVKANADAPTQADQGVLAVDELLNTDSKAQATAGAANAVATGGATTGNGNNNGNGRGNRGKGNGRGNAGNANGNAVNAGNVEMA